MPGELQRLGILMFGNFARHFPLGYLRAGSAITTALPYITGNVDNGTFHHVLSEHSKLQRALVQPVMVRSIDALRQELIASTGTDGSYHVLINARCKCVPHYLSPSIRAMLLDQAANLMAQNALDGVCGIVHPYNLYTRYLLSEEAVALDHSDEQKRLVDLISDNRDWHANTVTYANACLPDMLTMEMERYFDSGNRLRMDGCALVARDEENQSVIDYNLTNFYEPVCTGRRKQVAQFMAAHPNLHSSEGYGVASCEIDGDSSLRNIPLSHGRSRRQLDTRTFQAIPDLARGTSAPCVESRLQQGENTYITSRVCDKYAEREFARFEDLMNPCWFLPANQMPFPENSTLTMKRYDAVCDNATLPRPQTHCMGRM